eukprot:gene10743-14428_t
MEGFLTMKTTFSYISVYMILDGQYISCYDGLNIDPVGLRSTTCIKNAIISKFTKKGYNYGLSIKLTGNNKMKLKFDCADATTCSSWFNTLTKAAVLHIDEAERKELPLKFCKQIGLNIDEIGGIHGLTKSHVTKAYRKLCLKEHPDKGGDATNFNLITIAYNNLLAIVNEENEKKNSSLVRYEAKIKKGGDNVGLGLIVIEDKLRNQVVVQQLNKAINVLGLSEDSNGEIKANDALIGIDKDDCTHWPLSRIRARLGVKRVPVESVVLFTFERRIPHDYDINDQDEQPISPWISPPTSPLFQKSYDSSTYSANDNPYFKEENNNFQTNVSNDQNEEDVQHIKEDIYDNDVDESYVDEYNNDNSNNDYNNNDNNFYDDNPSNTVFTFSDDHINASEKKIHEIENRLNFQYKAESYSPSQHAANEIEEIITNNKHYNGRDDSIKSNRTNQQRDSRLQLLNQELENKIAILKVNMEKEKQELLFQSKNNRALQNDVLKYKNKVEELSNIIESKVMESSSSQLLQQIINLSNQYHESEQNKREMQAMLNHCIQKSNE